jgi:threonine dehydrogenase-like Zn-dependent dehydrogenase
LGRVIILGVATVPLSSVQGLQLALKEVQIIGSMTYAAPNGRAEYDMALDMLADNADVARSLITHRFPLDDAKAGFDTALDKSTQSIKVILKTSV